MRERADPQSVVPIERLSNRELQVLGVLAGDMTYKAAAIALGISVQTVKNHVTHVNAKLGTRSMLGALRAIGWVRDPSEREVALAIEELTAIRAAVDQSLASLEGRLAMIRSRAA